MNKFEENFLLPTRFSPAFARRDVPAEKINKFQGHLPDKLLEFWQAYGWSGYAKGLFWTVDPDEWEQELHDWLANTRFKELDTYYIIARSAFGKLILWGERTGQSLKIDTSCGLILPLFEPDCFIKQTPNKSIPNFINTLNLGDYEKMDENRTPLFNRALKKLNVLDHNTMYGFVPNLAMGGSLKLENLQKLDAHDHINILLQVTKRQILRDYYDCDRFYNPEKVFSF